MKKDNKLIKKKFKPKDILQKSIKTGELVRVSKNGIVEGRPPKWKDPELFRKEVDKYFNDPKIKHTWTGLALHLGFTSRQSLQDYKTIGGFEDVVRYAHLRIENKYEEKIMGNGNPIGGIFALKQMDWKDKQEIKHVDQPNTNIQINIVKANKDED